MPHSFRLAVLGCAIAISTLPLDDAYATNYSVLYTFCSQSNCADGGNPDASLIVDQNGNLYGTTSIGGSGNLGVVFKLTSDGTETVLHSFTGGDGVMPEAGLLADSSGNLYGTAFEGGRSGQDCYLHGCGTVYKLAPDGTVTVYAFKGGTKDGGNPAGGVIADSAGTLYGTTYDGGRYHSGVVFKLAADGSETVLYSFRGRRGAYPQAGLIMDEKENLYGTTSRGGDLSCGYQGEGCGVVFKVRSDGTEAVLHTFHEPITIPRGDGTVPTAGLIRDKQGNLYGTTSQGGEISDGFGVVFELARNGAESLLHKFANVLDGAELTSGLVRDKAGNLYGTTNAGGQNDDGTAFMLAPDGTKTLLYAFCSQKNCTDGGFPVGGLILQPKGTLYGTTYGGGIISRCLGGCGTVFEITQ